MEDVVALSPKAAAEQGQTERPIEPSDASSSLTNPGAEKVRDLREKAEAKAEEAEQSRDEARAASLEFDVNAPVNIGLAAAISIGVREMVSRYDVNGDDRLDFQEKSTAISSVQSTQPNEHIVGGGQLFRRGEVTEQSGGSADGEAFYAEMEANKAENAQRLAEIEKQERAREASLAEMEAKATNQDASAGAPNPAAGGAYARSEALGEPEPATHDVAKA
ncbi:hypothetical protein SAMN05421720_10253 [Rhodospira trueperi]|uniref:Uncharacterized protein n=1 Tax=Rhodospira trueperi TaxID=69960 RepID=A0A1G6YMG3_9PROT|nr:hypothetical protein SAMN05421720_10253 [Rhodospira trueperi]